MQKLREYFKKLLVSLLAISICLGYVPMTAYADEIEEVAIEETETIVEPISEEQNAPAQKATAESITEESNTPAEETPAESITEESNAPAEKAPAELSSEEEPVVEETSANLTEENLVNETAQENPEEFNSSIVSVENANPPEGQTEQEYIDEMKQKYGENIMDKIDEAVQNPTEENLVSVINQVTGNEAAVTSESLSDSEGNTITGTVYKSGDKYYQVTVDQETEKITINELVNVVEDNKVLEDLYSPDSMEELYAQYGEENVKTEEKFEYVPCLNDFYAPEIVRHDYDQYRFQNYERPDVLENGEVFYPFKYYFIDELHVYSEPDKTEVEVALKSTVDGTLVFNPVEGDWELVFSGVSIYLAIYPYSYDELMAFAQEGDEEKIALLKSHGYSFELGTKQELVGLEVTILGKSYYQLGNGNELLNVKIPVQPDPDDPDPIDPDDPDPIDPIIPDPVGPISIDIREHAENAISVPNNAIFVNGNRFDETACICYTSLGPINMKMTDVDSRTDTNQRLLARSYLGAHTHVVMTKNLYLGINISGTQRCNLVFNGFKSYEGTTVSAVVYNQQDKAYLIHGKVINGQAVFENFILRPASTITICY